MRATVPLSADPIFVEWLRQEGGLRVVAWSDKMGDPYLGIFALNRMGKPNGLPCWLRRQRFLSDMVIGFENDEPVIISIDAEVTSRGLRLVIRLPIDPHFSQRLCRQLFAPWGSHSPNLGFIVGAESEGAPSPINTNEEGVFQARLKA